MKQIITATTNEVQNIYPSDGASFYIDGEYAFYISPEADGGGIYGWTQCADGFSDGDVLEFIYNDETYRVYMYRAWPVQIAGPRLKELHAFNGTAWKTDPEVRDVAPGNIIELVEPEYIGTSNSFHDYSYDG